MSSVVNWLVFELEPFGSVHPIDRRVILASRLSTAVEQYLFREGISYAIDHQSRLGSLLQKRVQLDLVSDVSSDKAPLY
jgi:hypothetical protein